MTCPWNIKPTWRCVVSPHGPDSPCGLVPRWWNLSARWWMLRNGISR